MELLHIIQNKIIFLMYFKCVNDRAEMTTPYKLMNILNINDIYKLEVAKFIHSYNQKRLPQKFNMSLKPINQFDNYQTRFDTENIESNFL